MASFPSASFSLFNQSSYPSSMKELVAKTITEPETVELKSFFSVGCDTKINVGDSVIVQPFQHDKPTTYLARVTRISYAHLTKSTVVEVRRYYAPEETVGGRHTFYGNKELLLTNHVDTLKNPESIIRMIVVHSFVNYTRLNAVGPHDYFCRFEYNTQEGWLSPAIIEVFCKCQMPFNPDMFMLKCEACKERYHPACLNMTTDDAKQLDYFRCDDCLSLDCQRPHERKVETLNQQLEEQVRAAEDWIRAGKERLKAAKDRERAAEERQQAANREMVVEERERAAKEQQQAAEERQRAARKRVIELEEQVKEFVNTMKMLRPPASPPKS